VYQLAVALGRCRLFGVEPGEGLLTTLPPHLALAAAAELTRLLGGWADLADRLEEAWLAAVDPAEADNLCGGLLAVRMNVWAADTAIDEAHQDALVKVDPRAAALGAAIDRVQQARDVFDQKLTAQMDILSTAAGTHLLENWRALLADLYKEDLPWWLDGRLEEVARRLEEEVSRPAQPALTRPACAEGATEPPNAWDWLAVPFLAAAGTSPTAVAHRDWQSLDGTVTATLAAGPNPGPTVRVNFFRGANGARDLAGTTAFLAGVPAVIDVEGNADFDVQALRRARDAGRPLVLAVGTQEAEWQPLFTEDNLA
jgi:hypothetical protein